jgi:hypothetical protein
MIVWCFMVSSALDCPLDYRNELPHSTAATDARGVAIGI